MEVLEAMRGRKSTRAFLDRPVARETVESILEAARWAPSGVNAQPWRVAVVTGVTKERISASMLAARQNRERERPDYQYYPKTWVEPYKSRRQASGLQLYSAIGISKDDLTARMKAWNNNYCFFGAPVGLLFFIDRNLSQGSWIDLGMLIENVMLAARGHGLDTCPQASLAEYPDLVRGILGVGDDLALVCGMALGHADTAHPVNGYRTDRESVSSFTNWYE